MEENDILTYIQNLDVLVIIHEQAISTISDQICLFVTILAIHS